MRTSRLGRRTRRLALGAVIGAGGFVTAEIGAIVAGIITQTLAFPKPVDRGPDLRLAAPGFPVRSSMIAAADGTLLHVQTSGDDETGDDETGDVLVLIHGWTCNTSFWNPQLHAFGEQRRIVTYDQRGHGLSELGIHPVSVGGLGDDLQAVLEATVPAGRRAVLVGHSMGGMTIMSWAAKYGAEMAERVAGIVLTSTAAHQVIERQRLLPERLPIGAGLFTPWVARAFTSVATPLPSNAFTSRLSHYIALGPEASTAHVDFADELISACSPRARAAWGTELYHLDVRAGLSAITVPTTVVVGTEDLLTPLIHADELAEELAARGVLADYVRFTGAGHMVPFERADDYNRVIAGVLAAAGATAPA